MKKWMKTATAAMLAAALVSAIPANLDVIGVPQIVMTANAAETMLIAPGVSYYIGDTIDFGNNDERVYATMDDSTSNPTVVNGRIRTIDYLDYRSAYGQYEVGSTGIWITTEELAVPPKGIKVSGSGTQDDPYTFSLILSDENETLADVQYRQTAYKDDKYYTRFVFVTPKSELEGKNQAKFTATYKGTTYTYDTNTYYTGMISTGIHYTPESADSVLFVVTTTSSEEISAGELVCNIDFE